MNRIKPQSQEHVLNPHQWRRRGGRPQGKPVQGNESDNETKAHVGAAYCVSCHDRENPIPSQRGTFLIVFLIAKALTLEMNRAIIQCTFRCIFHADLKETNVRDDTKPGSGYRGFLGQVNTPLVFFALALLVIEGIIGFTVVNSKLNAAQQFDVILIMAGLFLAVVVVVAFITVKYPLNLMDKVDESLKRSEEMERLLASEMFKDAVMDAVADISRAPQSKEVENGSK